MPLTTAQLIAIAADIAADPTLSTYPHNSDGAFAVAALYNLESADPVFVVWKSNLSTDEICKGVVWTEYIAACNAPERDAFKLLTMNGIVDAGDANVRQGFLDIFKGLKKVTTRNNITAILKRNASRIEALLATGTGTAVNPGTLVFEGNLAYREVLNAWAA